MPAASSVVYQVKAVNGTLSSAYTNTAALAIPAPPGALALAAPAAPSGSPSHACPRDRAFRESK